VRCHLCNISVTHHRTKHCSLCKQLKLNQIQNDFEFPAF
jgi:hypothetical protein